MSLGDISACLHSVAIMQLLVRHADERTFQLVVFNNNERPQGPSCVSALITPAKHTWLSGDSGRIDIFQFRANCYATAKLIISATLFNVSNVMLQHNYISERDRPSKNAKMAADLGTLRSSFQSSMQTQAFTLYLVIVFRQIITSTIIVV